MEMRLAAILWCYKEPEVCRNHLIHFKEYNPDLPIYVLYGGPQEDAPPFKKMLSPFINDFYCYPGNESSNWKWQFGDLLLATWYRDRGRLLDFDSIFILQWDMLVLEDLSHSLAGMTKNDLLLSGCRRVSEVQPWWPWTNGNNPEQRPNYYRFLQLITERFGASAKDVHACLFIVVVLPRTYLDKYNDQIAFSNLREVGFLEYKVPTLAIIWGYEFFDRHWYSPWWCANPETKSIRRINRVLNAVGDEPTALTVLLSLLLKKSAIIHPYTKSVKLWGTRRTFLTLRWVLNCL